MPLRARCAGRARPGEDRREDADGFFEERDEDLSSEKRLALTLQNLG